MAGKIGDLSLDYEEMSAASKRLIKERDNFDTCIKNMTTVINSLPDIWSGKASEKYRDQFEDLTPSFEDTRDLIEDIATQMDNIVKAMQESDKAIADQVGLNK